MDFKKKPPKQFQSIDKISKGEAEEEIQALREGIDYHDYRYYVKNDPVISDARYDRLFHRLQELEDAFPDLQSTDSPTRRVGAEPVGTLENVDHTAPMLSLNAALDRNDIRDFYDFICKRVDDDRPEFVLEPKFDGFSVELVYENGRLKYGATRGDGRTGEDITHNLKTIPAVSLRLPENNKPPAFIAVRGEVFMPKKKFQELNRRRLENGREPFANPRNAAAGTMRQLDPKNVSDKPLDIIFYEILKIDDNRPDSHWQTLQRFPDWGFKTDAHNQQGTSFKDIEAYHEKMSRQRDDLEVDIDGIVVKLDRHEFREKLGVRQRSPRWAFAWKFPPKEEITRLEDIVVQVGRTGMLTPVALLQPVDVGGVTVSRATLHNEDEVRKKDVRPGDKVRIARAGDVIPEVVERVKQPGKKRAPRFSMPDKCPACKVEVFREGAYYFCPAGLKCPPQVIGGIVHYASRPALDIDGLGEKTAADLVEKDLAGDIADLYALGKDDLLKLDGFADKSAGQLYQAIQDSKTPALDRFIYALGIRHVGERMAGILAEKFEKLENIRKAGQNDLENIAEIGPEIARSVTEFFKANINRDVLDRLDKAGVKVRQANEKKHGDKLSGKTFVFTGELDDYTRQEAEDLVERLGGRATSSVSGNTDYVVAGADPGKKYDQAEEQGVEIIDEQAFKQMISR